MCTDPEEQRILLVVTEIVRSAEFVLLGALSQEWILPRVSWLGVTERHKLS